MLSGVVKRGAEAATGAGTVRVDAYMDPRDPGTPVPLAFAVTGADGRFSIRAKPPADLSPFAGASGMINLTLVYSDLSTGATRLIPRQVVWDPATSTWAVVSPPDEEWSAGNEVPVVALGSAGSAKLSHEQARGIRMASEGDEPRCRPYTDEEYSAISILPQPSTFVTVSEALAENRRTWVGDQWVGNDWTISSEYNRVSTTTVHEYDSVTWHADFSAKFPGVDLEGGVAKTVSIGTGNEDNTSLGFGYSVRNLGSDMPARPAANSGTFKAADAVYIGRTINNKYGVDVKTYARMWECIDPLESYVQGRVVYAPAMYKIVITDELSTEDGEGYHAKNAGYLLDDGTTNENGEPNYLRACGSAYDPDDSTAPVPPGGFEKLGAGKKQTFEKGQQLEYSAALRYLDVGGGHATSQSQDSAVTGASDVWTRWDNNTATQKYICGYGNDPHVGVNRPVIAAIGWRSDGT